MDSTSPMTHEPHTCNVSTLPTEYLPSPHFILIFETGACCVVQARPEAATVLHLNAGEEQNLKVFIYFFIYLFIFLFSL